MTGRSRVAPVIPLRPDATALAARGWHGMTQWPQTQYDWTAWATADPVGNALMVNVALWSPAATAGIIGGDYVVSIDGERLDVWDAHGAPVGTSVHVVGYRPTAGRWAVDVILASRPACQRLQRPSRPTTYPQVACGRRLGAKERLKWEAEMYDDLALTARARDLAMRLAAKYANAANVSWPGRARLARDLGVAVITIDRAKALLGRRGWLKWLSGRRTGETNRYWLTWPAGR
jgi:hypothetical protein